MGWNAIVVHKFTQVTILVNQAMIICTLHLLHLHQLGLIQSLPLIELLLILLCTIIASLTPRDDYIVLIIGSLFSFLTTFCIVNK